MEDEKKGVTSTPEVKEEVVIKEEPITPAVEDNKKFTQDDVNAIASDRATRAEKSAIKKMLEESGFKSKEELGEYLKDSKAKLSNYHFTDACNENKIRADKFNDIKTFLKGSELEMTAENIKAVAESHPEWVREARKPALQPVAVGNNAKTLEQSEAAEYEAGKKYFPSLRKSTKIGA